MNDIDKNVLALPRQLARNVGRMQELVETGVTLVCTRSTLVRTKSALEKTKSTLVRTRVTLVRTLAALFLPVSSAENSAAVPLVQELAAGFWRFGKVFDAFG